MPFSSDVTPGIGLKQPQSLQRPNFVSSASISSPQVLQKTCAPAVDTAINMKHTVYLPISMVFCPFFSVIRAQAAFITEGVLRELPPNALLVATFTSGLIQVKRPPTPDAG
jgi:hypothetical protein